MLAKAVRGGNKEPIETGTDMSIQAVIFDIGMVLMEWHPERFYERVLGAERKAALFQAVDLYAMNHDLDLGVDFRDRVYSEAEKFPEWADEIRMWHDNWAEFAQPDIPHSARLLRALRAKGIAVHALSNFGVGTFEVAEDLHPVLKEFDQRYVSGHLGLVKPDPAIYIALEQGTGLAPETLLFTDDRPENIDAAAARGWNTHLFDHPQPFADRLVAEGLLSRDEAA